MGWEPKCRGSHDWACSGGVAPRDFCYVCKRCGYYGWFRHLFDNNECRTYLNFYRFPFLKRFGLWARGEPEQPLPGMKRENYK